MCKYSYREFSVSPPLLKRTMRIPRPLRAHDGIYLYKARQVTLIHPPSRCDVEENHFGKYSSFYEISLKMKKYSATGN